MRKHEESVRNNERLEEEVEENEEMTTDKGKKLI